MKTLKRNSANEECKNESDTPVTAEATGTITKSLRHYLRNATGNNIKKLQKKTAILGTALILRKG